MSIQDYLNYWHKNGAQTVTPKGLDNPEGFNVVMELKKFVEGRILEVGCGYGRLAQFDDYIGVDICADLIKSAKLNKPDMEFKHIEFGEALPKADTTLFYTVLLHIPDDLLDAQIDCVKSKYVVIAEIMNPKYRNNSGGYSISNQRSKDQYVSAMKKHGYKLTDSADYPYNYYKGENITFLKFEKEGKDNAKSKND